MAPLLRKRLQCFYCGQKSAQAHAPGLHQWRCESCEAINFLDSNGDITDPPAVQETSSRLRYAQNAQRSVSPTFTPLNDSLFCKICLKNQRLLAQNLADYLPDPSDPRYSQYEEKYPEFRRNLEERYPQVCEICEPRVRERIRMTGYAAKTDHLRRLMENTRGSATGSQEIGWRYLIVRAGALGWWSGLLGQVLWHALASLTAFEDDVQGDGSRNIFSRIFPGSLQLLRTSSRDIESRTSMGSASLILAICSIWWNPTMLLGPTRRASGLWEYYKLQIILNIGRAVSQYVLTQDLDDGLDSSIARAIHATMLLFNVLVAIISYRTATMDRMPRVSFQDDSSPLIPRAGPSKNQAAAADFSQNATTSLTFPINSLGAPEGQPETIFYPPSPPTEDGEDSDAAESVITSGDAMDLDTPEKSFRPTPLAIQWPTPSPIEPSPFHGRLPAAPIGPAHKLRNPPNKPSFQKASPQQQQAFSRGFHPEQASWITPSGKAAETVNPSSRIEMAAPRFFASSERNNETGLESVFSSFFSLKDEPAELRSVGHEQSFEAISYPAIQNIYVHLFSTATMSLALYCWFAAQSNPGIAHVLRLGAFSAAALIASCRILDAMRPGRDFWVLSDILIFFGELAFAVHVLYKVGLLVLDKDAAESSFGFVTAWGLAGMALQEAWYTIIYFRRAGGSASASSGSKERSFHDLQTSEWSSQDGQDAQQAPVHMLSDSKSASVATSPAAVSTKVKHNSKLEGPSKRESGGAMTGLAGLNLGMAEPSSTWQGRRSRRQVAPWEVGSL